MKKDLFAQENLIINKFLDKNREVLVKKKSKHDSKYRDDGKLNYARFFTSYEAKKISTVANCVTKDENFRSEKQFARLKYDADNDILLTTLHGGDEWDNFYYGVSPIIDSGLIIKEIRGKLFQEENSVYKFVCKYAENFMIHKPFMQDLPVIAQYITCVILQKFGIKLRYNQTIKDKLAGLQDKNTKIVTDEKEKEKVDYLYVYGCPSKKFFSALEQLKFTIDENHALCTTDDGISIDDAFKKHGVIHNLRGDVYYSGVLLRATGVNLEFDDVNQGVAAIKMNFERTTYATIDALSNNFTKNIFLDKSTQLEIIRILKNDDKLKQELLVERKEESSADFLTNVNEYLEKTVSAVQIGVSSNLITSDDYLLFGIREKIAIDNNHIYPSVNGNAEIADKNVSFYKTSVKEDYPDIDINSLFRIDFNGEISREMRAELNIDSPLNNWDCYGICLTGTTPSHLDSNNDDYLESERRLHFNILFEQKINCDLHDVNKRQKTATEKYENKQMIGVRYSFFKNLSSLTFNAFKTLLKSTLSFKDGITTVMAIIVFFLAFRSKKMEASEWVTIIFTCLVFLQNILNIFGFLQRKKETPPHKKQTIIIDRVDKVKALKRHLIGKEMHPVVPILLLCYINSNMSK